MRTKFLLSCKLLICIFALGIALYASIDGQNALIELRREAPLLAKEVQLIQEENDRLHLEIERFESPVHLLELSRQPIYSHLFYPNEREILVLPQGVQEE